MLDNILGWLAIVAVMVVFGWQTWRSWRIHRALLKWPPLALAGLLTIVLRTGFDPSGCRLSTFMP